MVTEEGRNHHLLLFPVFGGICAFKDLPVRSDPSWQQLARMQSACKWGYKASKEGELAK